MPARIADSTGRAAYDNPTNLPYIEEYARMALIIKALEAQPKERLELAMVDGWLDELKRRCDDFQNCMNAKLDAKTGKVPGAALSAREAIYAAWAAFAEKFKALLILQSSDSRSQICDGINTLIDERNQAINTRRSVNKKGNIPDAQ